MFPGTHMNELLSNMVEPSVVKQPLWQSIIELRHRPIRLGHLCMVLSTE